MIDFTIKKYDFLLSIITKNKIPVYGINQWLCIKPENGILIRHDVDRNPENALKVAYLENRYNIKTTYYFRDTADSFNEKIIQRIQDLNHEIGYHYESLAQSKGDYSKGILSFKHSLSKFRKIVKISTISMHGSPLSPFDNKSLWDKYDFKEFGIKGEAFISIDYNDIYYFTDTGRDWGERKSNLRDRVKSNKSLTEISSTDDLIIFLVNNKDQKIALTVHPERWNDNITQYIFSYAQDKTANFIKLTFKLMRH